MMIDDAKILEELILDELRELKEHQENVKDHKYFNQIEVDYLHFIDMFLRQYPKEQIMETLNSLYDRGVITAVKNPQGLLFDIKLK
ncbi:hypothetical protein JOC37_001918 [Desulfohalotomaculum tongense]|uniref:hypothetical protein n=1 Tax=Desulforadius tongensis TaxID=1216062 RepID=UPI00195733E9|nr:hypothetical protein [Desulforadius tongensis]MBM7855521.1 hypothetical protein [Desulforadius tongensis]